MPDATGDPRTLSETGDRIVAGGRDPTADGGRGGDRSQRGPNDFTVEDLRCRQCLLLPRSVRSKSGGEASFVDALMILGLVLAMLAALVVRWRQEKKGDFIGPPLGKGLLLAMGGVVAGVFFPVALLFVGAAIWDALG